MDPTDDTLSKQRFPDLLGRQRPRRCVQLARPAAEHQETSDSRDVP
jgi:hypothetical protein